MLLASLASDEDPPRGGGVTWQQGTFDDTKYGIMTVNGKVVRSGPSATGDSFWDQNATPNEERATIIRTPQSPAPVFKTPQDGIVNQYISSPTINYTPPGVMQSIADSVKSVLAPMDTPVKRTEYVTKSVDYVTAAPSYFSLDSIFKSFGIDSAKPQPVVAQAKPIQQKKPAQTSSVSRPSSPLAIIQPRQSNINPLQFPQFNTPQSRLKSPNTMIPVLAMGAAGVALLVFGIALINRKKA